MTQVQDLTVTKEKALCILTINRPEKRNLLTVQCLLRIEETMRRLSQEEETRAVIIRGAGRRAFSAGYDVSALPGKSSKKNPDALDETSPLEKALRSIRDFPYPVIAMINGDAFGGGCELAVACDIRIAATGARMGMPPARLGLVYPYSGYRRFLKVLGFSRTLEIFLTGRAYGSGTCLKMGLVNHVVEDEDLETFTRDLATEISMNAPLSLKGTKWALHRMADYPIISGEDEARIRSLFIQSVQSEDMEEGKSAFFEKRKPRFKGR